MARYRGRRSLLQAAVRGQQLPGPRAGGLAGLPPAGRWATPSQGPRGHRRGDFRCGHVAGVHLAVLFLHHSGRPAQPADLGHLHRGSARGGEAFPRGPSPGGTRAWVRGRLRRGFLAGCLPGRLVRVSVVGPGRSHRACGVVVHLRLAAGGRPLPHGGHCGVFRGRRRLLAASSGSSPGDELGVGGGRRSARRQVPADHGGRHRGGCPGGGGRGGPAAPRGQGRPGVRRQGHRQQRGHPHNRLAPGRHQTAPGRPTRDRGFYRP